MADGITTQTASLSTIPTSTKIATDDAGAAGHVQIVKLAVDTDADASLIDLDGLLTSIKTAVETLDNAISGSEIQADIVAALPAGTNAIGKLAANSGVDIGDVDVLSIAAGDNNIGNVDIVTQPARAATTDSITAKTATDVIQNGLTPVTPLSAFSNVAASTTAGTVVTGVAGKKIRVFAVACQAGTAVTNATFNKGGTAISPAFQNGPYSGVVLPFNQYGWFETNTSDDLTITTTAGGQTGVLVTYGTI